MMYHTPWRIIHTALYVIVASLLSTTALVEAANLKTIPSNQIFKRQDTQGATIYCATVRGDKKLALKSGASYVVASDKLKQLKSSVKKASASKKKSLKAEIKKLTTKIERQEPRCKISSSPTPSPTSSPVPTQSLTPIPTLTPIADPIVPPSLDKITRTLTRADVQLLLDKAGLGLSSREEYLVTIGTTQGIDALVDEFMKTKDDPSGLRERSLDRLDGQLGSTATQTAVGQRAAVVDVWMHTNNPYAEKLALVLLGIWTVAGDVIEDETFRGSFWNYYERLRTYAYNETSMSDLGVEITRDPLMLIYLNNELNVKTSPNENYARELMELFTLGPTDLDGNPNYTETTAEEMGDIAVAARMLTGWRVKKDYVLNKLTSFYDGTRHAPGAHTMFAGKSHAFTGQSDEDLVRGIFAFHPGVRTYYAQELLKEYLTPTPPRALIEAFGDIIHQTGYRLRPALKVLFSSDAFYREIYRDTVPVNSMEFAAKSVRALELYNGVNVGEAERQLRMMGMQLNLAPSVFWYPQDSWIGSAITLEKANFIAQILNDSTAQGQASPPWSAAKALPVGAITSPQLIATLRDKLGLRSINEQQSTTLQGYLLQKRNWNGTYSPFTYDNTNTAHQKSKGLGVYYLMFMNSGFQLN
jgi:uncharacterized protein (DUF1800 family)